MKKEKTAASAQVRPKRARWTRDDTELTLLGLPATGAIGPLTWEGMAQLARDVLASSQTNEGQYPGYPIGEEATT